MATATTIGNPTDDIKLLKSFTITTPVYTISDSY